MNSTAHRTDTRPPLDADRVRSDFPILTQRVHGRPVVFLDSAASSQRPEAVINAVSQYERTTHANIHRGVYTFSTRATKLYEDARADVARFVGADSPEHVVFTRGTTEAINLVAQSYGRSTLGPGDEVLITELEHHSNIVPWQMVCGQTGASLRVVPMTDGGEVELDAFRAALSSRTKIAAFAHVSNALGTVLPVAEMTREAQRAGAVVLIDGAQGVPHLPVNLREIGCEFYAFSGHKMYAPTGIGALIARGDILDQMPPWQGGGDMILSVSFSGTTYNKPPHKFEAGTPNIAGAIGLGAAVRYLESIGMDAVHAHGRELVAYATERLAGVPGLTIIGTAPDKVGVMSFTLGDIHPHDIGTILDQQGVAVRTGHHCAQPVMEHFGIAATTRASFGVYTTRADVDALVVGLRAVHEVFG